MGIDHSPAQPVKQSPHGGNHPKGRHLDLRRRRPAADPGRDKNVGLLRKTLGELAVPLGALAGISFEQGKKSGRLRLRLRDGADPLLHATGGRLTDPPTPTR